MKNITINYENHIIEVSKAFLKKASVFGTPEYRELKEIRETEPTFTIKEKTISKKASKTTYGNLTFKTMTAHINLVETDEEERTRVLNELEEIKNYSAARKSSYPIVKKWFLSRYKESYTNFLKETEEEIS